MTRHPNELHWNKNNEKLLYYFLTYTARHRLKWSNRSLFSGYLSPLRSVRHTFEWWYFLFLLSFLCRASPSLSPHHHRRFGGIVSMCVSLMLSVCQCWCCCCCSPILCNGFTFHVTHNRFPFISFIHADDHFRIYFALESMCRHQHSVLSLSSTHNFFWYSLSVWHIICLLFMLIFFSTVVANTQDAKQ